MLRPSVLALGIVTMTGCEQVTNLLERGADVAGIPARSSSAHLSADDELGIKLAAYIDCFNGPSSRVLDAADRYASWADPDAGVTGEERNVYGIYDHDLDEACVEGIATANAAEPEDADLEALADAWLSAYRTVQPLIHDAHDYYDRDEYEDDGFEKGKKMHAGLVEALGAFQDADRAFRRAVGAKNDALHTRRLQQLETDEGRALRFQHANVLARAKALWAACDAASLEALNREQLDDALASYQGALDEAEAYVEAHHAEADSVVLFDTFIDDGVALLTAAKELARRKRDGNAFTESERARLGAGSGWMVEGSPDAVSEAYNDLIGRSNGLNWMRYDPAP